jgi:hypothetical protein
MCTNGTPLLPDVGAGRRYHKKSAGVDVPDMVKERYEADMEQIR